jgi:CRP/FNR family cyclic AMP-dependent transcriptional regulator
LYGTAPPLGSRRQAAKSTERHDSMNEADTGIATFLCAAAEASPNGELLVVPQWQRADWEMLFSHAQHVKVARGNVLIQQDAAERVLYFVASGLLEVGAVPGLSAVVRVHPGSVVGELSFLDGRPRAAKVWAVAHSSLYRLDLQDYQAFVEEHPRKACDLAFALGRIVALRLRRTMSNIGRQ